jgi:hypothetical protein
MQADPTNTQLFGRVSEPEAAAALLDGRAPGLAAPFREQVIGNRLVGADHSRGAMPRLRPKRKPQLIPL